MASTSWTPAYTLAVTGFDSGIFDSANGYGGLQEETTAFRVPCLTLRERTERSITVEHCTNLMVGRDMETIRRNANAVLAGHGKAERVSELWNSHATGGIAGDLAKWDFDQYQAKKSV